MDMDRKVKRRWHVRCRANKKIPDTAKKYRTLPQTKKKSKNELKLRPGGRLAWREGVEGDFRS